MRFIVGVIVLLVFSSDLFAQRYVRYPREHILRFRLGVHSLEGNSIYWDEKFNVFTGNISDFDDGIGGIDFLLRLADRLYLQVSADGYNAAVDMAYDDYVDQFGNPIFHTTTLDINAVTAGLVLELAPPTFPLRPYIGVGGGIYWWTLSEEGEFINFALDPPELFSGDFSDRGGPLGFYFLAGLDVPIGRRTSLFGEVRFHKVDDTLSEDFRGLGKIDLGGRSISGGIAFAF